MTEQARGYQLKTRETARPQPGGTGGSRLARAPFLQLTVCQVSAWQKQPGNETERERVNMAQAGTAAFRRAGL